MTRPKSRYVASLDGMRALAVVGVIIYHLNASWAQGGLLGVTVFFVLSGYLITGLLIAEWKYSRTIDLKNFWLRRIRRIVPAVVFAIFGTLVLCTLFNHELLTKMRPDIPSSLFFYNNWWYIFRDLSYFEALGAPSPLTHFWSLAIEEQFYVVWPLILLFLFHRKTSMRSIHRGILTAAALSALLMAILFVPGQDPTRVYYGTDTRAFSLLIGAWLAFMWPTKGNKFTKTLYPMQQHLVDAAGFAAVAGIIAMFAFANGFSPFLYRGGILLCSILTAIAIAAMVLPNTLISKLFSLKPFVLMGKISYSMYLWHYPILLLMNPRSNTSGPTWWMAIIEFVIIIGISAFSYKFIEEPIRHGAIGAFIGKIRSGEVSLPVYIQNHLPQAIACTLVVALGVGGCSFIPDTSSVEGKGQMEQMGQKTDEELQQRAAELAAESAKANVPKYSVLLIGDSVSVRAIPQFEEKFPDGHIDSAVNRRMDAGIEIYDTYNQENVVGDTIVISLGTNGVVLDEEIDALMADVGAEKHVYFVNTRSPQDWVQTTNDALASGASRYGNAYLIDWYSYSEGEDSWFDGDGTHLSEEGAQIYVDMIASAIA